jgi:rfaE bifunctional protein kinase chain/domain
MLQLSDKIHIGLLAKLEPKKVLLLGDLILDMYSYGQVARVSPEAPIQILQIEKETYLPGGAGNVAINLAGLGCTVYLCTRLGQDAVGDQLKSLLETNGGGLIDTSSVFFQSDLNTPLKNRLIASGQQLLRLDKEKKCAMSESVRSQVLSRALHLLPQVDIVAISDYGKGAIDRELLEPIFSAAKLLNIPVIVDPKSKDFSLYQGATLIKPNFKEALDACGKELSNLDEIFLSLKTKYEDLGHLIITRSQDGLSLLTQDKRRIDFPALSTGEVVDVTGAGDCVLAALVHGLSCNLTLEECCLLAGIAGSLAVKKVGCVCLSLKDLAWQMLRLDIYNKVFDSTHIFALKEACRNEVVHIMRVNKQDIEKLDCLISLKRYRQAISEGLMLVQVKAQELEYEIFDLIIQQPGIDLVILSEETYWSYPTFSALYVLDWIEGNWQKTILK